MKSNAPKWTVAVLWIIAAMDIVNGIEMFFFPSCVVLWPCPGVRRKPGHSTSIWLSMAARLFLAVGIGLVAAALNPRRNAIAVVIAAIAGVMHSILHLYSHAAGLLSSKH